MYDGTKVLDLDKSFIVSVEGFCVEVTAHKLKGHKRNAPCNFRSCVSGLPITVIGDRGSKSRSE